MAFRPQQEFQIALTDNNATTGLDLSSVANPLTIDGIKTKKTQLRIRPSGCDVVVKLGDSTVTASRTVTTSAFVAKNFTIQDGQTEIFGLDGTDRYISIQKLVSGDPNCKLQVTVGMEEKI